MDFDVVAAWEQVMLKKVVQHAILGRFEESDFSSSSDQTGFVSNVTRTYSSLGDMKSLLLLLVTRLI